MGSLICYWVEYYVYFFSCLPCPSVARFQFLPTFVSSELSGHLRAVLGLPEWVTIAAACINFFLRLFPLLPRRPTQWVAFHDHSIDEGTEVKVSM